MKTIIAIILLLFAGCAHPQQPARPSLKMAPSLNSSQPPAVEVVSTWGMPELLTAINARRRAGGSTPLRIDRGLSVVAERASAEYLRLGGGAEEHVLALAKRDLEGFGLSFSRTSLAIVVVEDVREASELLSAALDPSMVYAGLVVSQAPPPVGPSGGYSVMLTLAQ